MDYELLKARLISSKFLALTVKAVTGAMSIVSVWESGKMVRDNDLRKLAYVLATVYHETGATFKPVREIGKGKGRKYGRKIKKSGQPYESPNKIYYGRGYAQLTWYENYELMSAVIGEDLLNNPDLMLEHDISAAVLLEGMYKGKTGRGDFTGVSLENYFTPEKEDPINARRIINGTDKAKLISTYYYEFKDILNKCV